ncbi:MAG TPA: LLM class flavin-dependent oxidoreductase [Chloroflexota bacterium]|nr:LLM class flavin-dependent oxidoreductase [Chloroflexota bacterium]
MIETAGRRIGLGLAARGDVRDAVEWALHAENLGFESVWIHDSYFERDPITYLACVAREAKRIRVGAGALNPITRNPVVLAMTGSSLDDLAPGRFAMALGSGLPLRLAQMNIPFGDTVAEVSKAIDIIRTLWAGERIVLNANVPPLQPMFQPPHRIPIYIAGYQGRFVDLCGEKADGYLARPAESIPAFGLMRARARRVATEHGRNPDDIEFAGYVLALVGDTRRDALNRAKREPFVIYMMSVLSNVSLKRAGFPPELRDQIAAAWRAEEYHRAGELIPDELLDAFLACGTRDEVAAKALEYHEAGMDVPLIQPILQEEEQVAAVLEAGISYATDGALGAAWAPVAGAESASTAAGAPARSRLTRRFWRRAEAWYEILRPFSWTASIVPVSAAGAIAWYTHHFAPWLFLLVLVGAVGLQAGTNIINEIYDVRRGIDKITSPRASHALLKGIVREREAFALAFGAFGLVALIGLVLIGERGPWMLAFGIVGLAAGYSYTGPPFQYKFHALGVPLVFLLMGPLEVVGSYFAITGRYSNDALVASIPIGLLVAAILHSNEWRDISEDARANIATLSAHVGARYAHYLYISLITGAYLVTGVAAIAHLLPVSSLLVLLSLPIFVAAVRASELGASGQVRALSMIDLKTARLHMYFGLCLVIGLILARYIH